MLLEDKTAIVYGAGGAIGGAVARDDQVQSDVVATLAFLASDGAASITGTFVNVTADIFPS